MKHITGWFKRNNTLMAQVKYYERECIQCGVDDKNNYLRVQLHRVARERDLAISENQRLTKIVEDYEAKEK